MKYRLTNLEPEVLRPVGPASTVVLEPSNGTRPGQALQVRQQHPLERPQSGRSVALAEREVNTDLLVPDPVPHYEWANRKNKEEALMCLEGARLASCNGLTIQRDLYLHDFMEVYHRDLVYGHAVPALRHILKPFDVPVLHDGFKPAKHVEWIYNGYSWIAVPAEVYSKQIPVGALWAMNTIREAEIPAESWWTVEVRELPRDPYLAMKMGNYLIAVAWWI